ncbi:MAG TPA: carboxypeptidase regulatory-like domain-containing protein [Candidatus Dormibacteraeota bacterium]|nr:carboxypeptidase regulatory-like domain-containing protein [Candidatus Dormibacteraeota bacterium]
MKAARRRLTRRLGLLALLPLLGLVFWTAATIASSLPGLMVVAVNVHGIGVASYAGDSLERPGPLSIQVLQDVQGDATASRTPAPTASSAPNPVAPSHAPAPTPLPVPTQPIPTLTATPTSAPATIGGQVLDSQTLRPIVAATVAVSPGGNSALTDANGNFTIGVNAGSYTVTASALSYNKASQSVTVAFGQKATVGFRLVSVAAYGSLVGTVTNSLSRDPIAGATVTLSSLGMIRVTDTNGDFSYGLVLNGTYTLTVSATGYVTQRRLVTIKPGQTTTVQIALAHT